MSEIGSEGASLEADKPVEDIEDVKFPPFPDPSDKDFDDDLSEEEKAFYKSKFPDINAIVNVKLHCTACDRHLGCSAKNENRMRPHPMLRTLICHTCHSFYNSGEFDRGEDGSELYCRWCGQGGQVYCCSDCIHVFCAKCIKRNLGIAKIKEIENTDDWKCFKCNPRCLWELRAICWALLRFCDIRNKILFHTEDPELKQKYQRAIATDSSECCKNRGRRREKVDSAKKKEKEQDVKKILPKLPPTIQVKKFASINPDVKNEKKAQKRSLSPKPKMIAPYIQKPITIVPSGTPPMKKIRMPAGTIVNPIRITMERKPTSNSYNRTPKPRQAFPMSTNFFNGLQNPYSMAMPSFVGDNINLSLETLTQGLDMSAVAAYSNNQGANTIDGDVVCTPDFPLEPLCEVTEEQDDDVECITPGPVAAPKKTNVPPLAPRSLPDMSSDNIVQMTENDVTVNTLTGGLKFRVDPQTLSSKKMYRLPDGRIFAINPNPNMPGGYSATIVSVSDTSGKTSTGGETFAAKLSAVTPSPTPPVSKRNNARKQKLKHRNTGTPKAQKAKETEKRECDLKVPIEWYRYNMIDAVDALDYSLSRLNKLKKETTTNLLRTRTVDEIRYLHRTLEQLLSTSSKRFIEIRDNLNKDFKEYLSNKNQSNSSNAEEVTEDDDDVEFLPNSGNDDPIFIDENSMDSVQANESREVDLTGANSSEHNDSAENKTESDPLQSNEESILGDTIEGNILKESEEVQKSPNPSKDDNEDTNETNTDQDAQPVEKEAPDANAKPNGQIDEKQENETDDKLSGDDSNVTEKSGDDSNVTEKAAVELDNENKTKDETVTETSELDGKSKPDDSEIHDGINGEVEKDRMEVDQNNQSDSEAKDKDDQETTDAEMDEISKDAPNNVDANTVDN